MVEDLDHSELWNEFRVNNTLDIEKSDFHMQALFEPFMPLKNTLLFHRFSPISLGECTSIICIVS
jgi:hypothetical protein